jgi:hypothetical protein
MTGTFLADATLGMRAAVDVAANVARVLLGIARRAHHSDATTVALMVRAP